MFVFVVAGKNKICIQQRKRLHKPNSRAREKYNRRPIVCPEDEKNNTRRADRKALRRAIIACLDLSSSINIVYHDSINPVDQNCCAAPIVMAGRTADKITRPD
ncbi:hypothetical protein DAPPUDRAFT_245391 [Daphnia pulex]|uniref:Uncharacterized protein n=1 Tax=Daphnia pulex TaxID=6669 RepID=E9GN92_DAPPU|nr:hypothetical protein DAPPUDRAFT_245391 [Daphnia pulex]|eukprot:EFX78995.1 hypothetical protein DAPPUDRAFT_245391 [Daphnia pulex]